MNWTSWFSQNYPEHVMNKCRSITHKLWGGVYVIRPPRTTTCYDDMTRAPSDLDRVITLGLGDSGATEHLWDHTHKDLLYDTKPSSKSYDTAGSDDSGNNQIVRGVVTGKADISVVNLAQQPQCEEWSDQTIQVHTIRTLASHYTLSTQSRVRKAMPSILPRDTVRRILLVYTSRKECTRGNLGHAFPWYMIGMV